MSKRGTLFVMTGASGVGKDTIRQAALPHIANLFYSISATTRAQRPGDIHGGQYYFYDKPYFERLIAQDALLEYADFVGEYYGTPAEPVTAALERGQDALLELELVGARQVKRKVADAVMIFIAPPSMFELERRLRGRGTESEERIKRRLVRAEAEIKAVKEFDYMVVNDALDTAVREFKSIIYAERARTARLDEEDLEAFLRRH